VSNLPHFVCQKQAREAAASRKKTGLPRESDKSASSNHKRAFLLALSNYSRHNSVLKVLSFIFSDVNLEQLLSSFEK